MSEYIIKVKEGSRERYVMFTDGHEWKIVKGRENASEMCLGVASAMHELVLRNGHKAVIERRD